MLSIPRLQHRLKRLATVSSCHFLTTASTSSHSVEPPKCDLKTKEESSPPPNESPKCDIKPKEAPQRKTGGGTQSRQVLTWANVAIGVLGCGTMAGYVYYLKCQKEQEAELQRKRALGKVLIGGPWELVNHDGKLVTSDEYLGKWTLIYFGFTHCPDICPDEIEKMVKIIEKLESRKDPVEIRGLFFTVDAERDSPEIIKKYLSEFSPKLMGFTGSKEQVEKVTRTFRVYYSHGPKNEFSDYMVDHTIIIYLVDPDGNFVDYYGQRTGVDEIANNIDLMDMKRKFEKKKESGQLTLIDRVKHGIIT